MLESGVVIDQIRVSRSESHDVNTVTSRSKEECAGSVYLIYLPRLNDYHCHCFRDPSSMSHLVILDESAEGTGTVGSIKSNCCCPEVSSPMTGTSNLVSGEVGTDDILTPPL